MWIKYLEAENLIVAESWKELFEGEGLPVRLLPKLGLENWSDSTEFSIMVPRGREHVADEIVRKL